MTHNYMFFLASQHAILIASHIIIPFQYDKKLIPYQEMTSIDHLLLLLLLPFHPSSPLTRPSVVFKKIDMEDQNMLAADCIVISCCCQCMILQILIFILLKLPHKLLKKTKEYAKKFRARKKGTKIMQIEMTRYGEDSCRSLGRIDIKDFCLVESLQFGCCMDEIESVLDDFSSRGEFAFGSFWGGEVSSSRSFRSCLKEEELDYDDVRCHLTELFGAANFSYH